VLATLPDGTKAIVLLLGWDSPAGEGEAVLRLFPGAGMAMAG
jgi:hypothetical protein